MVVSKKEFTDLDCFLVHKFKIKDLVGGEVFYFDRDKTKLLHIRVRKTDNFICLDSGELFSCSDNDVASTLTYGELPVIKVDCEFRFTKSTTY